MNEQERNKLNNAFGSKIGASVIYEGKPCVISGSSEYVGYHLITDRNHNCYEVREDQLEINEGE